MSFQYVYCGGWSNFRGEVAGFKGEVKGLHVLKWNRNAGVLEDNGLKSRFWGSPFLLSPEIP